jgi:hypothetical protein
MGLNNERRRRRRSLFLQWLPSYFFLKNYRNREKKHSNNCEKRDSGPDTLYCFSVFCIKNHIYGITLRYCVLEYP